MAGSDTRKRTLQCLVRFTVEEFNAVAAKADRAGLTPPAFARAAMLGDAGPRARKRRPADHKALLQILGQIGRLGGNVNQIARQLNAGLKAQIPELRDALNAYIDIRDAIYQALGMTTSPTETSGDHQGNQPRKP